MKPSFFIQLILVIVLTAVIIPKLVTPAVNADLMRPYLAKLHSYYGGASMAILARGLQGKSEAEQRAYLQLQQLKLPHKIVLQGIDSIQLDDQKLLNLYKNQLVFNAENNSLYLIVEGHRQVLVMVDITQTTELVTSESEREGMGLMSLLQRLLHRTAVANWQQMITEKSKHFNFPISLQSVDSFSVSQQELALLQQGRLVARKYSDEATYGSGLNYMLQLAPDNKSLLVVGPIHPQISGWIDDYQSQNTWLIAIVSIALFSLWLLPSWRSSQKLARFINQQLGSGTAEQMHMYKGSSLNSLNRTFNQMAKTIQGLFADNRTAIYYLSSHLQKPLSAMQLAQGRFATDEGGEAANIRKLNESILEIKQLSTAILLFNKIQQRHEKQPLPLIDCRLWLDEQSAQLLEVCPQLQIRLSNNPLYCRLDSQLLRFALVQLLLSFELQNCQELQLKLTAENNKLMITMGFSASESNTKEQQLSRLNAIVNLLEGLQSKPTSVKPAAAVEINTVSVEHNLPLFTCVRILQQHCCTVSVTEQRGKILLALSLPRSQQKESRHLGEKT